MDIVIAVSATYSPKTNEEIEESGVTNWWRRRIRDTKFINSLFSKNIGIFILNMMYLKKPNKITER